VNKDHEMAFFTQVAINYLSCHGSYKSSDPKVWTGCMWICILWLTLLILDHMIACMTWRYIYKTGNWTRI